MVHGTRLALAGSLLLYTSGCAVNRPAAPYAAKPAPSRAPAPGDRSGQTIVIDAGHGGHDPGTSHYGLKEKYLALDIARYLRDELQGAGVSVIMTRDSDRFIPLSGRPSVANRAAADLFVSVHLNANKSGRVSGAEVYFPRESTTSATTQWPPFMTPAEVHAASPVVKRMLWDMVLRQTRSHSRQLAGLVCGEMREGLQVHCKVKPARFVVLRESWMPSVLVEVGYVSNREESNRLRTISYRQAAARAIAQGIMAYLRSNGRSS